MTILVLMAGVLLGVVCGVLYMRARLAATATTLAHLQERCEALQGAQEEKERALCEVRQSLEQSNMQMAQLNAELAARNAALEAARQLQEETQKAAQAQHEQMKAFQEAQMQQQQRLIREQFGTMSEEILKKRREELETFTGQQLASLLNPLHTNLKEMREVVARSDKDREAALANLKASIEMSQKQAQVLSDRADKLTEALTGETKTQGDFGELRLHTLLENMGLEEGVQYEEQTMLKKDGMPVMDEETGRRKIPDVVLHFPDNRDVVIDSKMSLTALTDYYAAETEAAREDALRRHLMSVRKHVDELAKQRYAYYQGRTKQPLDFVMMYVYNEGGLQLALSKDPSLWKDAYDKGVVIAGSQTLYMMLRVLEMTWHQVRQVENQKEIMETANTIVDRVQMFYERFLAVETQLERTAKAFSDLKNVTAPSGRSITTAARTLLKFGAVENKRRKVSLPGGESELLPEDADTGSGEETDSEE